MVTTVGSGSDLKTVVENMIVLEHDAIAAYTATIERLESPSHKARITEFRGDHERHMRELHDMPDGGAAIRGRGAGVCATTPRRPGQAAVVGATGAGAR